MKLVHKFSNNGNHWIEDESTGERGHHTIYAHAALYEDKKSGRKFVAFTQYYDSDVIPTETVLEVKLCS